MSEGRRQACDEAPANLGAVLSEIAEQVREKNNRDAGLRAEKYVKKCEEYIIGRLVAASREKGYASTIIRNELGEWLNPFSPWVPPELRSIAFEKAAENLGLNFKNEYNYFHISSKANCNRPEWLKGRSIDDLVGIIQPKDSSGFWARIGKFFGMKSRNSDFSPER